MNVAKLPEALSIFVYFFLLCSVNTRRQIKRWNIFFLPCQNKKKRDDDYDTSLNFTHDKNHSANHKKCNSLHAFTFCLRWKLYWGSWEDFQRPLGYILPFIFRPFGGNIKYFLVNEYSLLLIHSRSITQMIHTLGKNVKRAVIYCFVLLLLRLFSPYDWRVFYEWNFIWGFIAHRYVILLSSISNIERYMRPKDVPMIINFNLMNLLIRLNGSSCSREYTFDNWFP